MKSTFISAPGENARQNFSKNNTPISTFFENYVAAGVHGVSNLA
jgi:hypothetical protein